MGGVKTLIEILDLFGGPKDSWTAKEMQTQLHLSKSTVYRNLKLLSDAGLLTSHGNGGFVLGPRIVELDYALRLSDPMIRHARPVMEELANDLAGVVMLCRRYQDRVLCLHLDSGAQDFEVIYDRGRPMPLSRGAATRCIVAEMATAEQKRIYDKHSAEFAANGLGSDFQTVKDRLDEVQQAGYSVARSEIIEGLCAVAAPIMSGPGKVIGSLCLIVRETAGLDRRMSRMVDRVKFGAQIVSNELMHDHRLMTGRDKQRAA